MCTFAVPLCRRCRNAFIYSVSFLPEVRCSKCGKILISEHGECLQCREKCVAESLDAVYPLHMYRLWKKELVFSWKMLEKRRLSYFFADAMYHSVRKLGFEHLFFVPVPPRPGKVRDKGWDQVAELSSILEKKYGMKFLPLLYRKSSVQQKKLSRQMRLDQKEEAYAFKSEREIKELLTKKGLLSLPQEVVLMDDVITTGATVNRCASVLKANGIASVYAMSLFMVD